MPSGVRLEPAEEVRDLLDVIRVDLRNLLALLRLVLVVRDGVVRVRDADGRIGPVAQLAADQEGDDARDVGLPGEELQVEHQIDVLLEGVRDAEGHGEIGRRLQVAPLRALDAALHVPDRIEVLRQAFRVVRADGPLQAAASPSTESRMLRSSCSLAIRSSGVPPLPKRRRNTLRGSVSTGSGVVGVFHESVFM